MEYTYFAILHSTYIQQARGISMPREGIRKLLHRLRLSWTRPTYKLAKGDPDRQKSFLEKYVIYKN